MSEYGIYSSTLGWNIFGPLSAFLFEPTVVRVPGNIVIGGPNGPYEWWYLSTTPDLTGVFAYCDSFGVPSTPPPGYQYVGSYVQARFRILTMTFTDNPYLVVYTPRSSYLAVLQLPLAFGVDRDAIIYLLFYFQNTPLS